MNDTPKCRGADTEIFYHASRVREAAAICKDCPVMLQCRMDFASDPYAFAGGMTPAQRCAWVLRDTERRNRVRALEESQSAALASHTEGAVAPSNRGRALTEEKQKEIIELHDAELLGCKAIAERVGVSKSAAWRVLRAAGRTRTEEEVREMASRGAALGGRNKAARDNEVTVARMCAEGRSVAEIAEAVDLTLSHVYVIRRRLGLPGREAKSAAIIELTGKGYSAKRIARELGVSDSLVYQVRSKHKEENPS